MEDKKKRNQRTDAGFAEPQNTGCESAQREKIREVAERERCRERERKKRASEEENSEVMMLDLTDDTET